MKKARNENSRPDFLFTAKIRPNLFGREVIFFHGQTKFYSARFLESGRKKGQMATLAHARLRTSDMYHGN